MINISFNDVAVGNDLPAPRPAARPVDTSAFADLMDKADTRQDLPPKRDRGPEPREVSRAEQRDSSRTERPATPVAARHEDRDATESVNQDTSSKPASPVAHPRKNDTAGSTASDTGKSETQQTSGETASSNTADDAAANDDSTDASSQTSETAADGSDASQAAVYAAAATLIQAPSQPTSVPVNFDTTDGVAAIAPQAANPAAPLAQDGGNPATQPGSAAANPATPGIAPDISTSGKTGQSAASASAASDGEQPAAQANAATAGKVTPDTLAAATALAQSANADPNAASTPSSASQPVPTAHTQAAAPQTSTADDTTAATPTAPVKPPENALRADADTTPRDAKATPPNPSVTPSSNSSTGAAAAPTQQAAALAALAGTGKVEIDVSQAAPASLKPAPALANGMIAQINASQPADGSQTKSSATSASPAIGAGDGTTAPNTVPTQTAMAVAAAPVAQDIADEPRPKLAATADGLVVNGPAPTAGAHGPHISATDAAAGTPKPGVPTPPVFDQVAVHVAKAAADGLDKINIKLKPASLGQIEVQLEIATDGRIHAVIAADKPETLDLLQRDARALERALGDAGLRTDSGSLSFNLRGQNQQHSGGGHSFAGYSGAPDRASNDIALTSGTARVSAYLNSRAAAGGVDISV